MSDLRLNLNKFQILIPCCVVIYFSYLSRNFQLDDGLIYLRYIKNFHDGYGLVYNLGEKFNGLTSPLFTYIVLIATYLFRNFQQTTIVLSALFLLGAAIIGGKLFSEGKWEATFTAGVIGSFGYFYSTFGMETPLLLWLTALSLYYYKNKSDYFVITLALLMITRNEGVFLAVPMVADYLISNKKIPNTKLMAIGLAIFIFPFVFNYLYYGHFFPATGNAKIDQGKSGFWGDGWIFFNIHTLMDNIFSQSALAPLFLLIFSAYGAFSLLKNRVAVIAVIFFALLLCFYAGLNIPNYHWYYAPFLYLSIIFTCRGITRLSGKLLSKGIYDDYAFVFLLLSGASLFVFIMSVSFAEKKGDVTYEKIGRWIKVNTPDNASVAMSEIGTIGWYSGRKIIDLLGLVNQYNADYIGKQDAWGWLTHYQPDYILRHDPIPWIFEESTTVLESKGAYERVSDFKIKPFALLKKTSKYSEADIIQYAQRESKKHTASFANLLEIAASSEEGHPLVYVDHGVLNAHAPRSLSLTLKQPINSLEVSYGLKKDVEHHHSGVCFEILTETNNQTIMYSCIDPTAKGNDLSQKKVLQFSSEANEKLIFNTLCIGSCDYAWAYWKEVTLN